MSKLKAAWQRLVSFVWRKPTEDEYTSEWIIYNTRKKR